MKATACWIFGIKIKKYILATIVFISIVPSFTQAKQLRSLQEIIENSSTLTELDTEVSTKFRDALGNSANDRILLTFEQQNWLFGRRERCNLSYSSGLPQGNQRAAAEICIANDYRARLVALSHPPQMNVETRRLCEILAASLNSGDAGFPIQLLLKKSTQIGLMDAELRFLENNLGIGPVVSLATGEIRQFGEKNLWVLETASGSAHCESFTFFTSIGKTASAETDRPPVFYRWVGDFCGPSQGWAGTLNGRPIFIRADNVSSNQINRHGEITDFSEVFLGRHREDDGTQESRLTLTPWTDGHWAGACQIVVMSTGQAGDQIRNKGGEIIKVEVR